MMKSIRETISEHFYSNEFDPTMFDSHKKCYNGFVKWFNMSKSHMNTEEMVDMLEQCIEKIKSGELARIDEK